VGCWCGGVAFGATRARWEARINARVSYLYAVWLEASINIKLLFDIWVEVWVGDSVAPSRCISRLRC